MTIKRKDEHSDRGALSSKAYRLEEVEVLQEIEKAIGADADFPDSHCLELVEIIYEEIISLKIFGFHYARLESWSLAISKLRKRLSEKEKKAFKTEVKKLRSEGVSKAEEAADSGYEADSSGFDPYKYPIPAFLLEPIKLTEEEQWLEMEMRPPYSVIKILFFRALINNANSFDFSHIALVLLRSVVSPCDTYKKLAYSLPEIGYMFVDMGEFISETFDEDRLKKSAFYGAVSRLAGLVSIKPAVVDESSSSANEQPQLLTRHEVYDEISDGSTSSVLTQKTLPAHTQDLCLDATAGPDVSSELTEDEDNLLNRSWEARYQWITPNRYTRLTPVERQRVVHVLSTSLASSDSGTQDSAAALLLMYVTGIPIEDLFDTRVGDGGSFRADGAYRRLLVRPPDAYEPPPELASLFEAYQGYIDLQLPAMILPWIKKRLRRRGGTLLACMGGDREKIRRNIRLMLEKMRDSARFPRIRRERLSAALAVEVGIRFQDPTTVCFLSGRSNHAPPVLSYYVVHSVRELAHRYAQTVQILLDGSESTSYVVYDAEAFTGYTPTTETIQRLREGLSEQFRLAIVRKDDLINRHNAFTSYCLALLLLGTGHRPARDPFPALHHFDLDRGVLLINDKASDQERAWRLVALPELAVSQMREYLDYLPKIAAHLRQEYPASSLPYRIIRMIQGEVDVLSLFFLLDPQKPGEYLPITESSLAAQWSGFWLIPVNALRHTMATRLLWITGRADCVQLQLGHMTGADYPWGRKSTWPTLKTLEEIGSCLDKMLRDLGWDVLRHRMRLPSSGAVRDRGGALDRIKLGPDLRLAAWTRKQASAKDLIKELVAEQPPRTGKIRQDDLEKLFERVEIEVAARGYSKSRCRKLLYKYVLRQRGGKELIRQAEYARWDTLNRLEPSPFSEKTLEHYRTLTDLRSAFIGYLDQQGRRSADPTEKGRLVEIVCSAALFGGIANSNRLKMLGPALQVSTYRYRDRLFVDIPLSDDPEVCAVTRWFPDKISSSLIEGLFRSRRAERAAVVISEHAFEKFLGSIGSPGAKPLDRLAASSKAGLILEAPGYVAAAAAGDISRVSLPLSAWVRVESGQVLKKKTKVPEAPRFIEIYSSCGNPATSWSREDIKDFLHELTGLVADGRTAERTASKGVRSQQKAKLVERLQSAVANSPSWPALPRLLAAWAVHLCQHGTSYKSDLAYSTIEKYLKLVANRLCYAAADQRSFLELGGDDFERLYLNVIESEPKQNRFDLARQLYAFHTFVTDRYWADDLDWRPVLAAAGGDLQIHADANYITNDEYRRALEAVLQDISLSDYERWQRAGLLVFGYRYGLRFGEAFRLQYQDVQRKGDGFYLVIRSTSHGEVKTNASTRVAYLYEELGETEVDVLDKLLSTVKPDFEEDTLIPLMRASAGSRELQPRHVVAEYLGGLLKAVTGDRSIRYHHLRHGLVTRQVGALEGVSMPGFDNETLKPWVRQEYASEKACYALRSISVGVGHASEVTTLGSYTHCLDLIASMYYPDIAKTSLSDFAIAYAERVSPNTPRRRRSRGGTSGWRADIPSPNVETEKYAGEFLGQEMWQAKVPKLVEFDRLLRRFSLTGQAMEVAIHLEVDPAIVLAIVDRATKVEVLSGYRGYSLAERSNDPVVRATLPVAQAQKLYRTETERMPLLLEQLAMQLGGMAPGEQRDFFAGVEAWLHSTHRPGALCLVATFKELRALVNMAQRLGVSGTIIVDASYDNNLLGGLEKLGFKVEKLPEEKAGGKVGRVVVKLQSPREIGSYRSLRRLLFLLATASQFLYLESSSE